MTDKEFKPNIIYGVKLFNDKQPIINVTGSAVSSDSGISDGFLLGIVLGTMIDYDR